MQFSTKTILWIFVTMIILVCIPFAIQLGLQRYINSAIIKIENELDKATNHAYRFEFNEIDVNIFSSSIKIKSFKASANNSLNKSVFKADNLNLEGIGFISLFLRHKLVVDRIVVNESEIEFRLAAVSNNEDTAQFVNPYELIKKDIHSIFIKDILLKHTAIRYFQEPADSLPSLESQNSNVLLENVLVDSITTYRNKRWFDADKFLILSKGFSYITKDSLYTFSFVQLAISYLDSLLVIDSLMLMPNFSEKQFSKKYGEQTDRLQLHAHQVTFKGMDVKSLFEKRKVISALLDIDHLQVTAFRDKNVTRVEKRVATLQELIKSIPVYLKIDSILISDSKVTYKEIAPGSKLAGMVYFSDIEGTISNLTNDSLYMNQDIHIQAKAKLMGRGNLAAAVTFPYLQNGSFSMMGSIGEMDMKAMNPMLEPNAMIFIDDGTIREVNFDFNAGLKMARGNMTFKYNDLHIRMLDQETMKANAIKERLTSLLANKFIIINDNPGKDKETRKVKLFFERNPNRFIFNYTWKILLSGIKETLGLNAIRKKK